MTKIKICGITGEDEIAALNETGVDYAGFVLYEKSKRYVTVQKARQLDDGTAERDQERKDET